MVRIQKEWSLCPTMFCMEENSRGINTISLLLIRNFDLNFECKKKLVMRNFFIHKLHVEEI